MKVFIIESCSPFDLMNGVSESKALEEICKMMQHSVTSFFAKSEFEFKSIIDYISSINDYPNYSDDKICIHISCHGNDKGLAMGNDFLTWEDIAMSLIPLYKMNKIKSPIYLAISACGTENQRISPSITQLYKSVKDDKDLEFDIKPPHYIFVIDQDSVGWNDALLNWTILYHQIDNLDFSGTKDIKNLLSRIYDSGFGKLKYLRWDERKEKYGYYNGSASLNKI